MEFLVDIGGTPKLVKAGTLEIHETANRRCTASFRLDSMDRSYRADEGEEVEMTEDANTVFGGLIDSPNEQGFGGPRHPGISTTVQLVDFTVYAERRFVNLTLAAGTLKSQLATLVTTYLAIYGVTLDAGQVDGPAMPELVYDYKRLDAVLNELMTLTAGAGEPFIWEISYSKVFSAYQPSTENAPFDLVGNDLPEVVGDISVETSRSAQYANRIILKVAPKSEIEREETFVFGTDAYPYVPQYTPSKHYGYITHETIFETLRTPDDPDAASWTYDPTTRELERDAGSPSSGDITIFKFDGTFSGAWIAEDAGEIAARGVWERVIVLESIPNDTTGQAFADAELAKRIAPIQTVKYKTWEQGLSIGQVQTINVSSRGVNGTAVIVDIVSRDLVHRIERSVTAVIDATQTNLGRSFQDDYEIWYGDKSGGSAPAPLVSGVSSAGPGLPFTSVQFNRSGSFGGDSAFTYSEATNSLVCGGGGSSIDAEEHESCQVFGYDTHIGAGASVAAISLVASTIKGSPDGDTVTTDPIDTTGATLIVLAVSQYSAAQPMTDSKGNTWMGLGASLMDFFSSIEYYYCLNPTVGPGHTFTCTPGLPDKLPSLSVSAWSNVGAYEDDAAHDSVGTTSMSTSDLTPGAGWLVLSAAGFINTDTLAVSAPFTILSQIPYGVGLNAGLAHAYVIAPDTTPFDADWSWTTSTSIRSAVIAAFSPSVTPVVATGSLVAGVTTTVNATRSMAFGLDGNTNVHDEVGKFKVFGRGEFTEDLIVIDPVGDQDAVPKHYCDANSVDMASLVSRLLVTEDGSLVLDDDGVPLFSEG